jgi:hypothetical protein
MGGPILPRLKRSTWKGVERSVCRPLLAHRSPHVPWVALGHAEANDFAFVPTTALRESAGRAVDLEREAIRNVRVRETEWEESSLSLGLFKKLVMLSCQGDPVSSEKVLDLGFLRLAHARLRTDALFAGVPYRGMLTVVDANGGSERVATFGRLVVREYAEAGKDYVSPALFRIRDGLVVGVDDSYAEDELPQLAGMIKDDVDPGEPTVSACFARARGEDKDEIRVEAGGADPDRLVAAVADAVALLLIENPDHPDFGGNVRVVLLSNLTPAATRARLTDLEPRLRQLDRPLGVVVEMDGVAW